MILKITDDSGLIALVDVERYNSFVDSDWELDQLLNHFKEEMEQRHLLLWGTGTGGGTWDVEIRFGFSGEKGFRAVEGVISASNKRLYLINYDSLTMAAQFDDIVLPEDYLKDLYIQVEEGTYKCRIIQLFDPMKDNSSSNTISFVIELEKAKGDESIWTDIPWSEL